MPNVKRSPISLKKKPAFSVSRVSIGDDRLVYVMVADKKFKYPNERSRIVYIGTTKNGVFRVTNSIAERAEDILLEHGVESFDVRIVTCHARQRVKMWHRLEQAMLVIFREINGASPLCNADTAGVNEGNVFDLFSRARVRRILEDLA